MPYLPLEERGRAHTLERPEHLAFLVFQACRAKSTRDLLGIDVSRLCEAYLRHGKRWAVMNEVVGVLDNVAAEMWRRFDDLGTAEVLWDVKDDFREKHLFDYEDEKIMLNGDVLA